MILETIETINDRITGQLDTDAVQVAGLSTSFHDQTDNAVSLKLADGNRRFGMDSKKLWQSTHLLDGSTVTGRVTFGSFTDHTYDVRFVLIGLSKSASGLDLAMRSLDGVAYLVIDGTETDTLAVLQRYFRVKAGQEKNYNPDLYAFAIRYRLTGVRDDDYAELPTLEQQAQLPVKVPEPEVITVPVIVPAPGGSGDFIQLISTMSVSSGRLLAYVAGQLVYYDSSNPAHQYALSGIATNAANPGEPLTIQVEGEVTIPGWQLVSDQVYRAGLNGQLSVNVPVTAHFSQVVGRAKNANTFIFSPQTIYVNA